MEEKIHQFCGNSVHLPRSQQMILKTSRLIEADEVAASSKYSSRWLHSLVVLVKVCQQPADGCGWPQGKAGFLQT